MFQVAISRDHNEVLFHVHLMEARPQERPCALLHRLLALKDVTRNEPDGTLGVRPAGLRPLVDELLERLGWSGLNCPPEIVQTTSLNLQMALTHAIHCKCSGVSVLPVYAPMQILTGELFPRGEPAGRALAQDDATPRCPGCGSGPSDPLGASCDHPDGCGYLRDLHN